MKRLTKFIVALSAMTILFSVPVLATEKTFEAEIAMINNHVAEVEKQVDALTPKESGFNDWNTLNAHRRKVMDQTLSWAEAEFDNYILFIQGEEALDKENVRIKMRNVGSLTDLCKVNPAFQPQLEQAKKEVSLAMANVNVRTSEIALCRKLKEAQMNAIKEKQASYK